MLKFILGLAGFGRFAGDTADCAPWRFDPLAHPDLRSMS